jgi:hypothetical protein
MLSRVRPIGVSQGAAKRCRIIEDPSRDKAAHFALEASGNGYFTMILPNGLLEIGGLQTILSTGRQFDILHPSLAAGGPNAIRPIETARVHHAACQRGRMAACGAGAGD